MGRFKVRHPHIMALHPKAEDGTRSILGFGFWFKVSWVAVVLQGKAENGRRKGINHGVLFR